MDLGDGSLKNGQKVVTPQPDLATLPFFKMAGIASNFQKTFLGTSQKPIIFYFRGKLSQQCCHISGGRGCQIPVIRCWLS